jgi:hypothetical protein
MFLKLSHQQGKQHNKLRLCDQSAKHITINIVNLNDIYVLFIHSVYKNKSVFKLTFYHKYYYRINVETIA